MTDGSTLSAGTAERAGRLADAAGPQQIYLLVSTEGEPEIMRLKEGASLTIGRDSAANVCREDSRLSRVHARIDLTAGELWVEDLNSTNGTFVNGDRITRSQLRANDEVALGSLTISPYQPTDGLRGLTGFRPHAQFLRQAEDALTIARSADQPLTIVLLRLKQPAPSRQLQLGDMLRSRPQCPSAIALYDDRTLELLLHDQTGEDARQWLDETAQALQDLDVVHGAAATSPLDGRSAEALLSQAVTRLHRAQRDNCLFVTAEDAASAGTPPGKDVVAASESMRAVFNTARRLAPTTLPIIVRGETGVGKEIVARALHEESPRKDKPFCTVNCAALTPSLLTSTLFGHERGAFTGADRGRRGLFEAAHEGTLFLDEVGELSGEAQASLLRVLETGKITRVGSTEERSVDVRVVTATHRDLEQMCQAGQFRRDLYFRLDGMTLDIPPLRKRKEDIIPLAQLFLDDAAQRANRTRVRLSADAQQLLTAHSWNGNVRQLRNAVERAVALSQGPEVSAAHFSQEHGTVPPSSEPNPAPAPLELEAPIDLREALADYERCLIRKALEVMGGNKTKAAAQLQMPIRTLTHRMTKLGL